VYGDQSEFFLSGQIRRCRFSLRIKQFFFTAKPFARLGEPIEERSLIPVTAIGVQNFFCMTQTSSAPEGQYCLQCRICCRGELTSRHTVIREPCCTLMLEACPMCLDIFAVPMRLSDRVSQRCAYNYGTSSVTVARQKFHA